VVFYSSLSSCSNYSSKTVFPYVCISASTHSFKHTAISKCFGISLLLQGVKILSPAESALSDAIVEAGSVSISRTMIERIENCFFCSFHHDKASNVSHSLSSFSLISASIVFEYKLRSSIEPAPE